MAEKCQVCGGRVVNGRCSLCGMPYRNDEVLYHLNEPREAHYKHASSKVREIMRGYGSATEKTGAAGQSSGDGNTVRKFGNTGRNADRAAGAPGKTAGRQSSGNTGHGSGTAMRQGGTREPGQQAAGKNVAVKRAGTLDPGKNVNPGKPQSARNEKAGKSGGKGWIIWLIIGLLFAIPGLMDTIIDWIGTNL